MKEKSEKNLSRTISKRTIHAPRFLNEADEYGSAFSRGLRLDLGPYTFVSISGTASIDRCGRTYGPGDFLKQVQQIVLIRDQCLGPLTVGQKKCSDSD